MRPLTEAEIRSSLVNALGDEAARMTLPGLHEVVWDEREYLGWRDAKAPQRGYMVHWRDDRPVGVVLLSAGGRPTGGSAMCSLCQSTQPAGQVRLFSAARAGEAGRNGDTVGTYICADLACSILIRMAPPASMLQGYSAGTMTDTVLARRIEGLAQRVAGFTGSVLRE